MRERGNFFHAFSNSRKKFFRRAGTPLPPRSYTAISQTDAEGDHMDHKTQTIIEKFRKNPAMAQAVLQSGDGRQLMQLLTARDGGAALEQAAQNAAHGDTKDLAAMLSGLMRSPQGAELMRRLNDAAQK